MTLLIQLDPQGRQPLFRQIVERIVEHVEEGALSPGDRLPSSRKLSDILGVNRSTVYRAFQELWALGYIESRPGSYSYVRRRAQGIGSEQPEDSCKAGWKRKFAPGAGASLATTGEEAGAEKHPPGLIDFLSCYPDPELFPLDDFRRFHNRVIKKQGRQLLQYGDPRGYGPLRKYIAKRMRLHGVEISDEGILITAGAQGGLMLVSHLLAGPGDPVVTENPTYLRALELFRLHRFEPIGITLGPQGMDLDALEKALKNRKPGFVYTIPNFQNPTGWTSTQESREELLRLCLEHGVPVVEDGFEEEMKYSGRAVLPIKSMDLRGAVIYLGTFSKVLFPGLRVGWIAAAPDLVERLNSIQQVLLISGSPVAQAALNAYCRSGEYDRHLRRTLTVYRRRMETALKFLAENLSGMAEWTKPTGGYVIWLKLPCPSEFEARLVEHVRRFGVNLLPGRSHFIGLPDRAFFRLSIAHTNEATIRQGILRLAKAIRIWNKKVF